jgi:hypothetical protein
MTHGNTGKRNAAKPPHKRNDAVRIMFTTNTTQAEWLRRAATQMGMSVNALIRYCVDRQMDGAKQHPMMDHTPGGDIA